MKFLSRKKKYWWLALAAGLVILIDYWKTLPDYPLFVSYNDQEYRAKVLFPKSVDGKYGYVNFAGEMVVLPRYDEVAPKNAFFFMGKEPALVKLDGKYGYIDRKGKEVTPIHFDNASGFDSSGKAKVRVGNKWGWINRRGKEVIPLRFDEAGDFTGCSAVIIGNRPSYGILWLLNIDLSVFSNNYCRAKVRIDDKWGYINFRGKEVIPVRFDEIHDDKKHVGNDPLLVREGDRWFWVDNNTGKEITSSHLADAQNPKISLESLEVFSRSGKWGYHTWNYKGFYDEVIPPRFDAAYAFTANNRARVMLDGKWGFINSDGKELIPLRFDALVSFDTKGLARVQLNGKWGYINSDGKEVIPMRFDAARDFDTNGLAVIMQNGKLGYINTKGETVISPRFDAVERSASHGFAKVMVGGRYGWVNGGGQIIEPRFDEVYEYGGSEYNILAMVRQGKRWFWLDRKGEETVSSWCNTGDVCELHPVSIGSKGYNGYINRGLLVIPPVFYAASEFGSNGLAKVRNISWWGYINIKGETVVPLRYDGIDDFSENGLARIMLDEKYGYVNLKGKEIIPPKFDEVNAFGSQGLSLVKGEGKYGWFNMQGEAIIPVRFDDVEDFDDNGLAKVGIKGKYGFVNSRGETVTPLRFDAIYGFAESGMAIVKLDGKYGYINAQGQEVIPPQFDEVEGFDAKGVARVAVDGKWRRVNRKGEAVAED